MLCITDDDRVLQRFGYWALYASLNRNDEAIDALTRAYTQRFDALALRLPAFDPLRSALRFQDLMRRIGLNR